MKNNNIYNAISTPNSGFYFSNYTCDIITDIVHNEYGNETTYINIKKNKKEINFVFKNALYNSTKTSSEKNILLEFISINTNDINSLKNFFINNGFIFNNSFNKYTKYNYRDLKIIIKRVSYLVDLVKELGNKSPNIEILLKRTIYLLVTNPVEILDTNKSLIYKSMDYGIYLSLNEYKERIELYESYRYEAFSTAEIQFLESQQKINDIFKFNITCFYLDTLEQEDNIKTPISLIYSMVEKNIINIKNIDNEIVVIFPNDLLSIIENFNSDLKSNIIKVAKNIVKCELEHNIKGIRPDYNTDILSGSWYIPDLLSAIYFSIFFLNPKFEVIKKCANPTCSSYFSVLHSNTKKKYCSQLCANAVNQRNSRLRKKKNQ